MEAIEIAAKLMELSAKTAPKSKGVNFVQTRVLTGDVLQQLADEMVRIMYRIGTVARQMKMVDWDFVMGIPLSATGKNIYFDR